MATKPTITFVNRIRAQDSVYTSGPALLVGTATKIAPPGFTAPAVGAQLQEGFKANQKPPAQWQNFSDNRIDVWGYWQEQGSSAALLVPHVKEADSVGTTAFAGVVAGATAGDQEPITVTPNTGANNTGLFVQSGSAKPGAIFESTDDQEAALVVQGNGTLSGGGVGDPGLLHINMVDGDSPGLNAKSSAVSLAPLALFKMNGTAPCVEIVGGASIGASDAGTSLVVRGGADAGGFTGAEALDVWNYSASPATHTVSIRNNITSVANGVHLDVVADGAQTGLQVYQDGGEAPAARLRSADDGGTNSSAPLELVPQSFALVGSGLNVGSIWVQTGSYDLGTQYCPRFYGQGSHFIQWSRSPHCGLDVDDYGTTDGAVNDLWFDIISSVEFPNELIPILAGKVVMSLDFSMHRTSNVSDIVANGGGEIRVVDVTNGGNVLFSDLIDLAPLNNGTDENRLKTYYSKTFEPTLGLGAREFQIQARRQDAGAVGSISVTDMRFRIRPRP